jgi:hypothetical protein
MEARGSAHVDRLHCPAPVADRAGRDVVGLGGSGEASSEIRSRRPD